MNFSIQKAITSGLSIALLLVMFAIEAPAQKKSRMQDAARHSSEAAKVFTEIMNVRDKAIPKELLDKAEAIAVFPGVIKAAFIFGGRGGQGVISRRQRKGWSAPAFFNLSGGSFGAQIGAHRNASRARIRNILDSCGSFTIRESNSGTSGPS